MMLAIISGTSISRRRLKYIINVLAFSGIDGSYRNASALTARLYGSLKRSSRWGLRSKTRGLVECVRRAGEELRSNDPSNPPAAESASSSDASQIDRSERVASSTRHA